MKNLQILKEQKLARNWYWFREVHEDCPIKSRPIVDSGVKGVYRLYSDLYDKNN
jgi:hypothetical protein